MTDLNPAVTVRPVKFQVCALPEGHADTRHFAIDVEEHGDGRWAVARADACLGADGTWADGVKAYGRGETWLDAHRFDFDTALRLAEEAAPHVVVSGRSVADVLAAENPQQPPSGT